MAYETPPEQAPPTGEERRARREVPRYALIFVLAVAAAVSFVFLLDALF